MNFYHAKVLKLCYDHRNTMTIKEATDVTMVDLFEETIEHNKKESNPYEHYDDTCRIFWFHPSARLGNTQEKGKTTRKQAFAYGCKKRTC